MKILIATENHFAGYGGPYYAIGNKLVYLLKNKVKFKLIYKKTDNFNYRLNLDEIIDEFDIVHIYGIWRPFYYTIFNIAKKKNKKIFISPLGALEPWSLSQKKFKKKIAFWLYQKKILNNVDQIHATSEIEKKNIVDLGIRTKITVIPHGIEILEEKKKNLNPKRTKKAIFFSRIHEKKGLLELIEAWSKLNQSNWVLDIYGPVSDEKYLKNVKLKINQFNLNNFVKIYQAEHNVEKKTNIFKGSDCFILPSKSENFGISIGEALAHGLPVLTTTETPWQQINNYNAGVIYDVSKDNFSKVLESFLSKSDQELYNMGINGQRLIKEKFDNDLIIKKYINLYNNQNFQ